MHAAGHAMLAGAGGLLARTLAGGSGPMDGRSTRALEALGRGDSMVGLALVGLAAALAKLAGGVVAGWSEARVAGEVAAELRLEVLDGVLGATSLRATRQSDHGAAWGDTAGGHVRRAGAKIADLASLTSHVSDVERGIAEGVFAEVRAVLQLAPLVLLLAVLAPRLAGTASLALGGFAALVMVARRALKRHRARASQESVALLGAADEAVRHAELWRTYGAEGRIRAHLAALGRRLIATASRLRARTALLSGTSEVLGALALVLTLALVQGGAAGGVDRAAVLPFAIAFFMAYKPLRELIEGRLARGRAEDALAEATSAAPIARPSVTAPPLTAPAAIGAQPAAFRGLLLEGLVAEHGAHAPLTLRLEAGKIAAIVGPTGVGKTSLLRVLLGLEPPRAGTIAWDGEDLTRRAVGPTERPFAWVPQDAPILGDTLAANIMLGRRPASERSLASRPLASRSREPREDAGRVLEALGARGLALALGDAILGTERPVSGGERQWVAVARALATELPVLLLDEPTSSLDAAAQARMLDAIAGLRGTRTVLLVTHRPEPLAIADVVVRLAPASSPLGAQREQREQRGLHREHGEHGPGRDDDARRAEELAIEDVRAVALALGEAEHQGRGERVDAPSAE
jgi:ABC-type multidrug transport system fused ATPase/permease subunit